MNKIPEKSLMLEFLEENSEISIDKIRNVKFAGENYIVDCVINVPDRTMSGSMYGLTNRKKSTCTVSIQQFKNWENLKKSIKWL